MQVRWIGLLGLCVLGLTGCSGSSLFGGQSSSNNGGVQSNSGDCAAQSAGQTLSVIPNRFIVEWMDGHFSVETSENAALFKRRFLDAHPNEIRRVEYDMKVQVRGQRVFASAPTDGTWGPSMINVAGAYAQNATGQGVQVAVVDAAVDYTQPQLVKQLSANMAEVNGKTGIDDDGNGYVDDYYGWDFANNTNNPAALVSSNNEHATHVSGIILADPTQGPVQGVAPGAKLIPVNFMDNTGSGNISDAMTAIQYAVSRGAKVINASWGGSQCSQSLKNMMSSLSTQNILFVVAAGNDSKDIGTDPDYPANFAFSNQINVASTNSNDFLSYFSNFSSSLVHLAAPGDTILSTVPGATQGIMSGTSMAAPFVSGAAAILWGFRPNATPAQIKAALLAGVDQRGLPTITAGRLNVANSLKALQTSVP